jgi:tripartite-type tricarboxylate transporter receptor subunit TctC
MPISDQTSYGAGVVRYTITLDLPAEHVSLAMAQRAHSSPMPLWNRPVLPETTAAGDGTGDCRRYAKEAFMRRNWKLSLLIGLSIAPLALISAQAQSDFYKGKTVAIVIGAKGGSLTVAAQIVGRHLGKHIPGNPTVIVRQMPGAAHLNATNHIFNVDEADGLTILAANPNVGMAQLAKLNSVRFDIRKFVWLGSTGPDGALFAIRASLPHQTFKELQDSKTELVAGTTGPGSNAHDFPLLLKEFAGAKLRLVSGYSANSDILLALDRGEADVWSALGTTVQTAIDRGSVRPLVRGRTPVPGWNHLPVDETLTTDPIGKSLMAIRGIPQSIGRALAVRPGTPADRVAILREAIAKTVADPEFRSDAERAKLDVQHITAEEVAKGFDELMNQPPAVLDAMGKYLKPGSS